MQEKKLQLSTAFTNNDRVSLFLDSVKEADTSGDQVISTDEFQIYAQNQNIIDFRNKKNKWVIDLFNQKPESLRSPLLSQTEFTSSSQIGGVTISETANSEQMQKSLMAKVGATNKEELFTKLEKFDLNKIEPSERSQIKTDELFVIPRGDDGAGTGVVWNKDSNGKGIYSDVKIAIDKNFNTYYLRRDYSSKDFPKDLKFKVLASRANSGKAKIIDLVQNAVILPINLNPTGQKPSGNFVAEQIAKLKADPKQNKLIGIVGAGIYADGIGQGQYWVSSSLSSTGEEQNYKSKFPGTQYGFYIDQSNKMQYLEVDRNNPNWESEIKSKAKAYSLGGLQNIDKTEKRAVERVLYIFPKEGSNESFKIIRTPALTGAEIENYAKNIYPNAGKILRADDDFYARVSTFESGSPNGQSSQSDDQTGNISPLVFGIYSTENEVSPQAKLNETDRKNLTDNLGNPYIARAVNLTNDLKDIMLGNRPLPSILEDTLSFLDFSLLI